uniref:Uncharacterized protein n=1 Tax=Amblyomma maculatum TaxID=34609 RepID=G3MSU9_AMBMU
MGNHAGLAVHVGEGSTCFPTTCSAFTTHIHFHEASNKYPACDTSIGTARTMIFTLALCLLAAATAAAKENAENYIRPRDMRLLVQVKERLIVIMRTHTTRTHFRCQSAKRVKSLGKGKYVYNLMARNGTYPYSPYTLSNVTVKLEKIQRYKEKYMSIYYAGRTRVTHMLMKIGRRGQCYVIHVTKSDGQRGCELLVPHSQLLYRPPKSCIDYFNQWCPGKRLQLYEPGCVYI